MNATTYKLTAANTASHSQTLACKHACTQTYKGRTESHEQLFFACELGTADEGESGGR